MLIVDDDDVEQLLTPHRAAQAVRWRIALDFATDRAGLIEALADTRYDLVICDNRMPEFRDYRDIAAAVRAAGHDGAIAVASASLFDRCFDEHAVHGVLAVVDKLDLDGARFDALLDAAAAVRRPAAVEEPN